ncbi:MAG: prevent-host-death protein [Anaerolineae bacterium CG1_02_58_13]|nr:MAG: prevent-host-death protein [Anaerolineae bacterium CG1_02_58_13]
MKTITLTEAKGNFPKFLRMAEKETIVITRHGKPAGVLIGFEDEDAWFEYKLENDTRFLARVERARKAFREGKGIYLENLKFEDETNESTSIDKPSPSA